jgi:hypothetical protein
VGLQRIQSLKINSFRSVFRKELQKVRSQDVLVPVLTIFTSVLFGTFHILSFLNDQETPRVKQQYEG